MMQSWSRSALQPGECRRCMLGVSNDEGQQTAFDARLDVRAGRTHSQRPRPRAAMGSVTHAPSGRALSVKGIAGSAARRASAMATIQHSAGAGAGLCFATVPIVASTALAVTVGDHRTVCSPQPAAADRRPRIRGGAPPPPDESRTAGDADLGLLLLARLRSRARRRRPTPRRSVEVCESYDPRVSTDAREVAAGGFLTDPGRGT